MKTSIEVDCHIMDSITSVAHAPSNPEFELAISIFKNDLSKVIEMYQFKGEKMILIE